MTAALEFEIFYKIIVKIDEMFPFQFWWQSQIKHKIKDTAHKIIERQEFYETKCTFPSIYQ